MSEWISVDSERKPLIGERVVFADIDDHGNIYSTAAGFYGRRGFNLDAEGLCAENYDGGACVSIDRTMEITHWFPLPMLVTTKDGQ